MLGKLMKYEFKATGRVFLPLYAAMLIMAAVTKLMFSLQLDTPRIISLVLSILLMIAAFVVTFILAIQRFYKNFLTDEGYLMFTLPADASTLIGAKLLVAILWNVVCTGVAYLALSMMAFSGGEWQVVAQAVRDIGLAGIDVTFFTIEFIALILTSLVTGILTIYTSISLSMFSNKHRVALSFVFYIALTTVMQILTSIILQLFSLPISNRYTVAVDEITANSVREFFSPTVISTIHTYAAIMLLVMVGFGAAMFFTTRYMLKNQLNLQ